MATRSRSAIIGAVAVAAVVLGPGLASVYGEWLWFGSVGFRGVFLTILSARLGLFAAGAVLAFAVLYGNHRWTVRTLRDAGEPVPGTVWTAGLAVLALLLGAVAAGQWETVLAYLNAAGFGTADPLFGLDAVFYVFHLPLYRFALGFAVLVVAGALGSSLLLYALRFGGEDADVDVIADLAAVEGGADGFSTFDLVEGLRAHAYGHVMAFIGAVLLLTAASVFLSRFELLYSARGAVFGPGHTDVAVSLPVLTVLSGVAALGGLIALANTRVRRFRPVAGAVALLVLVAVAGQVAGWAVQGYVVEPDEFNKEREHIGHEIDATRQAFALERVSERQFPVSPNLSRAQIEANPGTIDNVRLWDWRPLLKTYNELQIFRTYYTFTDVDIDRYDIGGRETQVMVSPREIDFEALPEQSRSWVNRHLVYTHGFGLTMSPVRNVTEEGLPELVVQDIPPRSSAGIEVDQPRIYYGEETDTYAVVNTGTQELDYPSGDRNVYTSYAGSGGVPLSSSLREAVFSMMFGAPQIFFSGSVRADSRLQFHRDIRDRVRTVAPFLEFDHDPYIVTVDGRLKWIYDAYTTTDRYPHARPVDYRGDDVNYMRNSVKVVVDAYSGEMTFYAAEPDDPLLETYGRMFPGLFEPLDAMPAGLRDHVRYPEDLFSVQADVYRDYHMQDPQVFYNREDQWRVPDEVLRGSEVEMEPYYIIMTLPGEDEPEFVQILPFIPRGKENMIGWLAARSDRPNYGELEAFQFSKQELVFGPMQVESRIDQNAQISQQITLWSQSGSEVLRGNLLAIPIDDTILYVEPLFLVSREEGALPELKRVIVAHGDRITMQPTLDGALAVLFGEKAEEDVVVPRAGVLDEVRTLFEEARTALEQGDFATYGDRIDEIERLLAGNTSQSP